MTVSQLYWWKECFGNVSLAPADFFPVMWWLLEFKESSADATF